MERHKLGEDKKKEEEKIMNLKMEMERLQKEIENLKTTKKHLIQGNEKKMEEKEESK